MSDEQTEEPKRSPLSVKEGISGVSIADLQECIAQSISKRIGYQVSCSVGSISFSEYPMDDDAKLTMTIGRKVDWPSTDNEPF